MYDCFARLFSAVDGIFCLFQGHIENIAPLKQQYGLTKTANEVSIVIEAYRTLRDRGPYPADHVVRDFKGKFAFIVYDNTLKSAFAAGVSSSVYNKFFISSVIVKDMVHFEFSKLALLSYMLD